jgi:hypothetical protein
MNMIGNASHRKRRHSVLARDAADVGVEPVSHLVADQRSPSGRAEDDMNETADVTVRHGSAVPDGTFPSSGIVHPALACWATVRRPCGTTYRDKRVDRL